MKSILARAGAIAALIGGALGRDDIIDTSEKVPDASIKPEPVKVKPRRKLKPMRAGLLRTIEKRCVQCNKKHNHNNRWCSADCCEMYRNERGDTIGTSSQRRTFKRVRAQLMLHTNHYGA